MPEEIEVKESPTPNLETIGMAIALAIKDTRKLGQAEQGVAIDYVMNESGKEYFRANMKRLTQNWSADRQELEKCGICRKADHEPNAYGRAVANALAIINRSKA